MPMPLPTLSLPVVAAADLPWLLLAAIALNALILLLVLLRTGRADVRAAAELRTELRLAREEAAHAARELREELSERQAGVTEALLRTQHAQSQTLELRLSGLRSELSGQTRANLEALERVRNTLDARVREMRDSHDQHLESMRQTVDEKLQATLERRLGESFRLVSERLEAVQLGLGEMQTLASGVGELKRVLTNVKARGTWAEVQLGSLLEEVLTPAQFERNVAVRAGSAERVEYALRLPGPGGDPESPVWLPIDSKFPQEDWLRLQQAADLGDEAAVKAAAAALARSVLVAAKAISEKYVQPPHTTDFAILFLATEGLHAEILRNTTLMDEVQRRYRIVLAGPTTLTAMLSSLRMGFRTLAIEQRAAEVWQVLGMVKTEFEKFAAVLTEVEKHLGRASETLGQTGVRTRAIERRLREVETLPVGGALPEGEAQGAVGTTLGGVAPEQESNATAE